MTQQHPSAHPTKTEKTGKHRSTCSTRLLFFLYSRSAWAPVSDRSRNSFGLGRPGPRVQSDLLEVLSWNPNRSICSSMIVRLSLAHLLRTIGSDWCHTSCHTSCHGTGQSKKRTLTIGVTISDVDSVFDYSFPLSLPKDPTR